MLRFHHDKLSPWASVVISTICLKRYDDNCHNNNTVSSYLSLWEFLRMLLILYKKKKDVIIMSQRNYFSHRRISASLSSGRYLDRMSSIYENIISYVSEVFIQNGQCSRIHHDRIYIQRIISSGRRSMIKIRLPPWRPNHAARDGQPKWGCSPYLSVEARAQSVEGNRWGFANGVYTKRVTLPFYKNSNNDYNKKYK